MDCDLQNIGARIRRARKNKGMSQGRLSELLQISETYMSDIERGKSCANMLLIKKIAVVLEVSSDWLLLIDNDKTSTQTSAEISELIEGCTQAECEEIFKIMRQVKRSLLAIRNDSGDC